MKKSYCKVIESFDEDSRIEDFKDLFEKSENGIPVHGMSKLLYDTHMHFNIEN